MIFRSYLRNSFGLIVIQGLNLLVPVLLIPIVTHVQGVEGYGEYATVLAYYYFCGLVCDYGFDLSSVRALKIQEGNSAERTSIIRGTLSAKWLLFVIAGPAFAALLATLTNVQNVTLLVVGLLLPCANVFSVHWLYLAEGRLTQLLMPIALARLTSLAAMVAVYPRWPSTTLIVLLTATPILSVHIVFWIREQRALQVGNWFSLSEGMRAIRLGFTAFYITFLSSYISMSAVPVLSALAPAKEVGVLAAVERMAKAGFGVLKPFLVALYPEMSAMFKESTARWSSVVGRVIAIGCAIGAASAIFISCFWTKVSAIFLGDPLPGSEWIAYGYAAWLTLGVVNNAIGIQGLIASGNELVYRRAVTTAAGALTMGYLAFGTRGGALGIVFALLVAEAVLLLLNARAFLRLRRQQNVA